MARLRQIMLNELEGGARRRGKDPVRPFRMARSAADHDFLFTHWIMIRLAALNRVGPPPGGLTATEKGILLPVAESGETLSVIW